MNVSGMILASLLFAFAGVANAQNVHGILKVVKGDVQIKGAKTGQVSKARIGAKVFPKDVVITAKDARAKIVMVDNNEINISPESQIEIQHYEFDPAKGKKEVLLNVIYGKVRAKVEQKYDGKTSRFQVKTPAAVAGVRGTDFLTSFNRSTRASSVVTFTGKVEFGTPGPGGSIANAVSVTPGTQASSTGGAPPTAPAPVPKSQLAVMDSDTQADAPGVTGGSGSDSGSSDGATEEKKEDRKDDAKKDDSSAKKEDSAKKDDTTKKEDGAAKNEEGTAKKEEGAAKKDDTAAKKDEPAKKEDTAKKQEPAAAKNEDSAGTQKDDGKKAAPAAGTTKEGGKSADSGGGKSESGSGGGTSGGRSPASAGGASSGPSTGSPGAPSPGGGGGTIAIDPSRDVVGGGNLPVMAPSLGGTLAPNIITPIAPVVPTVPICDFCNTVIQDSTSKLIIQITN